MDWDDLRIFLAVAREGSLSAAARRLGVEHSTVLRRIAALERALGVPLFYRTAAGHRVTPHGASVLSEAEVMERAALGIGARAREQSTNISGRVRIALLEELAVHWLAPLVADFHRRYPSIELELIAGIPPVDIARGETELAIRTPRPKQAGLAAVKLARVTTGLYASRAFLGRKRLTVNESSRGLQLLVFSERYHGLQRAAWFQPVLSSSTIVLRSNHSSTLLSAAHAGAGIAVLPRFIAGNLVAVSDDTAADDFWLVTHPDYRRDPKVRVASEFLREAASALR